jgi:hypothetical protein
MTEETGKPILSSRALWITGLVIVALAFGRFLPGSAQDTTGQRISDLETRVATLEAKVFGTPVASPALMATPVNTLATSEASTGTFITTDRVVFRGAGSAVSDNFTLEAGTYRVSVIVPPIDHAEHLGVTIQPAPGSTGVGFAGLVNDYQPEGLAGEFLVSVYTAGEFVIAADGNRPYTVTVELEP